MKVLLSFFRNRSIIIKIMVVFLIIALLISVAVRYFFIASLEDSRRVIRLHIKNSALSFVDHLGTPPDQEKALQLSRNLGVDIHYRGKYGTWSTKPGLPKPKHERENREHFQKRSFYRQFKSKFFKQKRLKHEDEDREHFQKLNFYGQFKNRAGYFFYIIDRPYGRFTFYIESQKFLKAEEETLLGVSIFIILVFILGFLLLKKIFNPLRDLNSGVKRLANGELNVFLPVYNQDELGKLTNEFNIMASHLKSLIEQKGQLLLDVSHELRTPLTRMKIGLEFINESKYRQKIKDDIEEIEAMLTELLMSARLESRYGALRYESIDLNRLLNDLVAEKVGISPGIEYLSQNQELYLEGDQKQLKILFNNLIDNALKYSIQSLQKMQIIAQITQNDKIEIQFNDFGEGIPKEDLPYIFEPFYRADKSRSKRTGGYGIGLHLCQKIVKKHNGEIFAESTPRVGTTIKVFLPKKALLTQKKT